MAIKDRVQGERYKAQGRRRSCLAISLMAIKDRIKAQGTRFRGQITGLRTQATGSRHKCLNGGGVGSTPLGHYKMR
jgi:hypothetical protein